jgi:hypothetical protein
MRSEAEWWMDGWGGGIGLEKSLQVASYCGNIRLNNVS